MNHLNVIRHVAKQSNHCFSLMVSLSYKAVFHEYDKDGSGDISRDELLPCMKRLGWSRLGQERAGRRLRLIAGSFRASAKRFAPHTKPCSTSTTRTGPGTSAGTSSSRA